jgi:uncharacterized protein YndB with AHSA1/START domain
MRFTNTITIDRTPAEVFAFLTHFENVPRWNWAISETRKSSSGTVGVGTKYIQSRTVPKRRTETFEITEYEPDQKLSMRGQFGPFSGQATYELESMGEATTIANAWDLESSGLLTLAAPLAAVRIKSAVAANLEQLKKVLEVS